jgi:hypothetical protein
MENMPRTVRTIKRSTPCTPPPQPVLHSVLTVYADTWQSANLGILSVRFPVKGLAAYRVAIEGRGVAVAYAAKRVTVRGIGTVDLFAIRDLDGNITEFYEKDAK